MIENDDPLINLAAAAWLGMPKTTLYAFRHQGRGPHGYKIGGRIKYKISDLETWLESHAEHEAEA